MSQKYLLAVDAGTGSVRAVLFDLKGNQLSCAQHEWEHREDPRYPGSMDFDWGYNWALARDCIKEVLAQSKIEPAEIAAISTTCMREGIILYDAEGKEIWACANVDARSTEEVEELIRKDPQLERELYAESGQSFALDALPRLLWIKNKMPEIYQKAAVLGMFNDWLIDKLTGVLAIEPSNGSTTGIFDLKKRSWDPSIAERCGLRTDIFPPVQECGSVAGKVSEKAAAETGLSAGTPVVVGGGDAQLGCVGVGVVGPNQAAIFGGSFWQYEFNTTEPKTDPVCRVRVNCHAVPGLWQYEALAFKPGLVMRWFRDGFCQLEKQRTAETGKDPYYLMDQEAKKIPAGCYGMLCAFSDVMNFIRWKHAAPTFTNFELDPDKFNRYTFYKAILENTAMVTKGHLDLVRESTGNMPREVVFAGGASKSPVWCQILADVLGLPVRVPVVKEATALGAAILAGFGVGIYGSIQEAAGELVQWDKIYRPDPKNHEIYERIYPDWRKVYAAQLELSNQNLTRSMWSAPGL
ncbi:Autoinducer-2 kinase [Caprobacter fermentans]|uniref:Autoinducer-2 kinase n=1 Tax=Caproicibacter fermentans TaxID=2576756 RepID=A0A6N8I4L5_9FIRM|nr:autoinducer-2 kinase [Caproicibacter fermentans]MVB12707.1 Autoinducer-2 kinase [Caproicibacter fermentans]